jgi:hypothetical protein
MATKAEQFRSEQQRSAQKKKRKPRAQRKPKKSEWSREKKHAAVKATHALEDAAPGARPSRVSTRASANRAKSDAPFNITEETRKGSPEVRAQKARVDRVKVRGRGR